MNIFYTKIQINPLTFHHIYEKLKIAFYVTTCGYENAKGLKTLIILCTIVSLTAFHS